MSGGLKWFLTVSVVLNLLLLGLAVGQSMRPMMPGWRVEPHEPVAIEGLSAPAQAKWDRLSARMRDTLERKRARRDKLMDNALTQVAAKRFDPDGYRNALTDAFEIRCEGTPTQLINELADFVIALPPGERKALARHFRSMRDERREAEGR